MREDVVEMTKREMERWQVLQRVLLGELTQAEAGEVMGLFERQVRRLVKKGKKKGPRDLVHGSRGKLSPKAGKLEAVFCIKAARTIHNGYCIRWKGKRYAIQEPSRRMLGRPATVLDHFESRTVVRFERMDLR